MRVAFSEAPGSDPTHDGAAGETARTVTWTLVELGQYELDGDDGLGHGAQGAGVDGGRDGDVLGRADRPDAARQRLDAHDSDPIASATVSVSGFASGDDLSFGTVTGATLGRPRRIHGGR